MSTRTRKPFPPRVDVSLLVPGARFDTSAPDGDLIETGCTVISGPGAHDEFLPLQFIGLDSDDVECEFHVQMVSKVY